MSRRIEITVTNDYGEYVQDCLHDEKRCNLGKDSEKPNMIVELRGRLNTLFMITVPGPAVSGTLEHLRKSGIGVTIVRVILTSIDFLKPDLSKPLFKDPEHEEKKGDEETGEKKTTKKTKAAPLKGFQHFQKARRTTEELYNDISTGANMNMNTWMNLVGASIMAAGGLATNTTVFIVAAMLVSPIMGPILGMTFGYRIADWPLFRAGFINELKMAIAAFLVGLFYGFILGDVGNTYNWPTTAMQPSSSQGYNLIISILVSAAAGLVLGVSLTTQAGNALVGTAISAGLLPPIVNAGMMIAYSIAYAPISMKDAYYEMGNYAILFYATHVLTIVVVANVVFWLKDIDPRFREGEDASFEDIPSLVAHRERLEAKGQTSNMANLEKAKAEYFVQNIKDDLEEHMMEARDRVVGGLNFMKGGLDKVTFGMVTKAEKSLGTHKDQRARSSSEIRPKDKYRRAESSANQEDDSDVVIAPSQNRTVGGGPGLSLSPSRPYDDDPFAVDDDQMEGGEDRPQVTYAPFDPSTTTTTTHHPVSTNAAADDEVLSTVHNPLNR